MAEEQQSARDKLKKAQMYEEIEQQIEQRVQQRIEKIKKQTKRMQYAANPIELGQWTCDPDAKEDYPDISKDEYLGNLDKTEYKKLTQDDELVGILMTAPEFFGEVIPECIRRRKSALSMSNSKNGFARRQLSDENINIKKHSSEETGSAGFLNGAFKRRR